MDTKTPAISTENPDTRATRTGTHLAAVLTQQERSASWLARKTGKSPSYVTRVMLGERRPSADFMGSAAEALGVPASILFPEADAS